MNIGRNVVVASKSGPTILVAMALYSQQQFLTPLGVFLVMKLLQVERHVAYKFTVFCIWRDHILYFESQIKCKKM